LPYATTAIEAFLLTSTLSIPDFIPFEIKMRGKEKFPPSRGQVQGGMPCPKQAAT
jgi:hypothetical protein